MKTKQKILTLLTTLLITTVSYAGSFQLKSNDITQDRFMPKAQEFQGFGCNGSNLSPQLSWTGAPKGTVAFAILLHDPDAPTGLMESAWIAEEKMAHAEGAEKEFLETKIVDFKIYCSQYLVHAISMAKSITSLDEDITKYKL